MSFAAVQPVPVGLATPDLVLRPITVADVEQDYAAVMESRILLRPWEQTGWPADDFTLAEDLADLAGLEERHRGGRTFTYTVLDPDGTECLGCVYLMPPDARAFQGAAIDAAGARRWADVGAAVYFWVRTSRIASGLDAVLVGALRTWLAAAWPLTDPVFVTSEACTRQVEVLEAAGLERRFTIIEAGKPVPYVAFGEPASSIATESASAANLVRSTGA